MTRLVRMPFSPGLNPAVAEYSVQVTYLQLMLELPWNETTRDNLDLECARKLLEILIREQQLAELKSQIQERASYSA